MSTNRLSYDECSYKQSLFQSVAPVNYTLDPIMFEHKDKCRMELGSVGGTNVSHIRGNLVDLENDLRGQRHPSTKCSMYKHQPTQNNVISSKEYIKPVEHPDIDVSMNHLNSCQLFDYKPVPKEPEMRINRCG
uniref:Uncharacterized protein n=1 Tax=Pyramimonas orientalis virus TaxID=455367 RepID=A0A7M3UP00_POV01|nr:hypothetical protein HWQ62_00315 [Pyramimonas orientalis virus]